MTPFKRYPISVSRGPFWICVTDDVKKFLKEEYGKEIKTQGAGKEWIQYLAVCALAEFKYRLRGSKAKVKKLLKK